MTMPTFAAIFEEAEAIAVDEQAFEVASLIAADEHQRPTVERNLTGRDIARYQAIMQRAYSRLALLENTRGRIRLD
jgi:hypothetical protein